MRDSQYNVRELLVLTAVVAVVTAAGLMFGWLNVTLVVFHPLALFVYVAMIFERRIRRRRKTIRQGYSDFGCRVTDHDIENENDLS